MEEGDGSLEPWTELWCWNALFPEFLVAFSRWRIRIPAKTSVQVRVSLKTGLGAGGAGPVGGACTYLGGISGAWAWHLLGRLKLEGRLSSGDGRPVMAQAGARAPGAAGVEECRTREPAVATRSHPGQADSQIMVTPTTNT